MKKLAVGLLLSLSIGATHAAYEPKTFDIKHNSVVSNPGRGADGRNYFLNFIREIRNNVRDNFKTTGIARALGSGPSGGGSGGGSHSGGGGIGGGGGGGGGVCR